MRTAGPAAFFVFVFSCVCYLWLELGGGGAARRTYQDVLASSFGGVFDVEPDEVLGQFPVEGLVHLVEDEVKEVKAGNERWWEIDVAGHGEVDVVFGSYRIGGGKERRASVEGRYDSRFGY